MADAQPIVVTVRLFAVYRERVGADQVPLSVPEGSTVSDVMAEVGRRYPRVAALAGTTMVAVNQEYAEGDIRLRDGDEVALIPPVSGGASHRAAEFPSERSERSWASETP